MGRHYFRCKDCLSVGALEIEGKFREDDFRCDCGGYLEYLGEVRWDKWLIKSEINCACDDRCTSAKGPNCSCKCGGKNHGTGAVVEILKAGEIPALKMCDEKAKADAAEYRALREKILAGVKAFGPGWLPSALYWKKDTILKYVRRARENKVHKARMKNLGIALDVLEGRAA